MIPAPLSLKAIAVFHLYFHLVSLSTQEQWWIPLLKYMLYSGNTDTKSSINYPEHPEFEESAQGSYAGNSIRPFTAAGWIQQPWVTAGGNRNPFTHNMCSHEHIKLICTPESGCVDISSRECCWESIACHNIDPGSQLQWIC